MLFDSHNHLQSRRFGKPAGELIGEMKSAGICGCVANATQENDWNAVRELEEQFPDFVTPAYGIHPWYADTAENGWEDRLRKTLKADTRAAVGEVGVDGWVGSPAMGLQYDVFVKQAEIAADLERVMTVHCLKAWEELFRAMDEADAWPEKFLMHSFGGSIEVAERLMKHDGVMFSFSGYFLQERKEKSLEVFRKLPKDRILLETDAPDMMPPDCFVKFPLMEDVNHPANLGGIAEGFAKALGGDVLAQVSGNGNRFWDFR